MSNNEDTVTITKLEWEMLQANIRMLHAHCQTTHRILMSKDIVTPAVPPLRAVETNPFFAIPAIPEPPPLPRILLCPVNSPSSPDGIDENNDDTPISSEMEMLQRESPLFINHAEMDNARRRSITPPIRRVVNTPGAPLRRCSSEDYLASPSPRMVYPLVPLWGQNYSKDSAKPKAKRLANKNIYRV